MFTVCKILIFFYLRLPVKTFKRKEAYFLTKSTDGSFSRGELLKGMEYSLFLDFCIFL